MVDARLKIFYRLETIPGAIKIPFTLAEVESPKVTKSLFKALSAKVKYDGSFDFNNAKDIVAFCSGIWCEQSTKFIKGIVKHGYPTSKLYWYRGGFQAWKLLGLTTLFIKQSRLKSR